MLHGTQAQMARDIGTSTMMFSTSGVPDVARENFHAVLEVGLMENFMVPQFAGTRK